MTGICAPPPLIQSNQLRFHVFCLVSEASSEARSSSPTSFLYPDFVCSGNGPNFKLRLIRVIHENPAPQFLTLLAAMGWPMTQLWLRKHEKFLMLEHWGNFDFPTTE